MVGIKWSVLITLEESSFLHDGTFKLSRDSNLAAALKGEVLDTHTHLKVVLEKANLGYSRGN